MRGGEGFTGHPSLKERIRGLPGLALLFLLFTAAYEFSRYLAGPGSAVVPLDHAREIIRIERDLGLFIEPSWQRAATNVALVQQMAVWLYKYEHLAGSIAFLAWVWVWRPTAFPFVWRWFWVAHVVALVGFLLFPLAPPRLVPELGLADPTAADLANTPGWDVFQHIRNDFAAMPSLHVGYPLIYAAVIWSLHPDSRWRGLAWIWPATILFVVVATANHYVLDAVGGAFAVAVALGITLVVFREVPRPWTRAEPEFLSPST